jgi:hypothetical protein
MSDAATSCEAAMVELQMEGWMGEGGGASVRRLWNSTGDGEGTPVEEGKPLRGGERKKAKQHPKKCTN